MLCRPGKLGSGSIISIRPNSCGPSARQHRDAPNPHGHPAPWNGEPSGRNRAEPRPLPKKPSRRDRWFESCSLQRRVQCEPNFRGRIPSMTLGFRQTAAPNLESAALPACTAGARHPPQRPYLDVSARCHQGRPVLNRPIAPTSPKRQLAPRAPHLRHLTRDLRSITFAIQRRHRKEVDASEVYYMRRQYINYQLRFVNEVSDFTRK